MKKIKGQIIPIVAVSMVVLLAFAAMAIDGGNFYLQRQRAQNASDQAVIAAALEYVRNGNWFYAGLGRAAENGYDNDGILNTVEVHLPPISGDYAGVEDYVQVIIRQIVEPFFLPLFYDGDLEISVTSVSRAEGSYEYHAAALGSAIVSLGNCVDGGDNNLTFEGGGSSGGIVVLSGGIFLNSPENSGNSCALNPPNNGYGIHVWGGEISSVGSYDYDGASMVSPNPIVTNYNSGIPITDPWEDIPEPTCNSGGTVTDVGGINQYTPGTFATLNTGVLAPGIYCITGDILLTGNEGLTGSGVLLFVHGDLSFSGNGFMSLQAPTSADCLGTAPDTSASCSYIGMVIFASRDNTGIIQTKGNGANGLMGMVYVPNGTVQSAGGGSDPNEVDVEGQVIAQKIIGNGNGSFTIDYNASWTMPPPDDPPIIEMTE